MCIICMFRNDRDLSNEQFAIKIDEFEKEIRKLKLSNN